MNALDEHVTTVRCDKCTWSITARHGEDVSREVQEHDRGHLVWNREAPALLVWALVPVVVVLAVAWMWLAVLILGGGQ